MRYLRVEFYFEAEVFGIQGNDVAISIVQISLEKWRQVTHLLVCLVTQTFSKIEHITTLIPHIVTHLSEDQFNLSAASVQRLHIKVGNHWTNQLLIKFSKHNCKTDLSHD